MIALRRIAPGIPKINYVATIEVKFLSTPAVAPVVKRKIYETEKEVKYVRSRTPTPDQKRTGNTVPNVEFPDHVPNPVGRFYQEIVHKGRLVCLI
jgi:hypothetical protein